MNLVERLIDEVKGCRKRIVVIGDVLIDRWVSGCVAECQDGCPKFVTEDIRDTPGGAANARQCLQHWDVLTDLFSYPAALYPVKCRFVTADGRIAFRWDDETTVRRVERSKYRWVDDLAMEMVKYADGVLLPDYDKGFLTPGFVRQVADLCRSRNIPCVVDAKLAPEVYSKSLIMKCNHDYSVKWRHFGDVCTAGAVPPLVGDWRLPLTHLPPIECRNHVGAGDCFAAHLTLALAYGFTLEEAAAVAHSAGRVYVQHPLNRAPEPHEVWEDVEKWKTPSVSAEGVEIGT